MIHEHKTNKLIKLHIYRVSAENRSHGLFWTLVAFGRRREQSGRPAEYSLSCLSAIDLPVKGKTEAENFEKTLGLLQPLAFKVSFIHNTFESTASEHLIGVGVAFHEYFGSRVHQDASKDR